MSGNLLKFYKYQGTGNDFILIDGRLSDINLNQKQIAHLCDRRFGIGADGLIILMKGIHSNYFMKYYNSDGNESSMCGNGGRCFTRFASHLGIANDTFEFDAIDGLHIANIQQEIIELKMIDVSEINRLNENDYELNTGSPHYIHMIDSNPEQIDLLAFAKNIRYNEHYKNEGINVNVLQIISEGLLCMRTYERGVEDETLSCGTGTVASVLAYLTHTNAANDTHLVHVNTPGGQLSVKAKKIGNSFSDIFLIGPAIKVFEGIIKL